jgi:hypothetical protein
MSKKKKNQSSKKRYWIPGLIILAVVVISSYRLMVKSSQNTAKKTTVAETQKKPIDPSALTGRWLRPDGGYVLQLGDIGPNGQMKAQYFNPNPINVAFSQWKRKDDRLTVFVELRDTNYPGSTYNLTYIPTSDRMRGIYYQATMQQQFEVEFVRLK